MKWKAEWWGITLVAETESDKRLLKELETKLPKQAETSYDAGVLTTYEKFGEFCLEFSR